MIHNATRFIPTGVGNTKAVLDKMSRTAVHPHGCGEHQKRELNLSIVGGSSPRVWGTRMGNVTKEMASRFIPTGVGNTACFLSAIMMLTVHPHGCGEHFFPC